VTTASALDRKLLQLRQRRGRTPTRNRIQFANAEEKACYIDGAARDDARLSGIKALAAIVARLPPHQRAQELYDFVRRNVDYVLDPDGEEFEDAQTTLIAGQDDCDGTARALAALCIAAGLDACVRAILSPDRSKVEHFQAVIRWPGSAAHPMAMPGGWILADTTLNGVVLGQGAEAGESKGAAQMINLREVTPGVYSPVLEDLRRATRLSLPIFRDLLSRPRLPRF